MKRQAQITQANMITTNRFRKTRIAAATTNLGCDDNGAYVGGQTGGETGQAAHHYI